jgi:predicted GNAT family N-acyltransferase
MHSTRLIRIGDYLVATEQSKPASAVRVKRISFNMDLEKAFAIRMRVFVKEQGVPAEIELDRDDKRAIHFLAYVQGCPVGTARVVIRHGKAKIGRMAVLRGHRRKSVGTKLLKRAVSAARKQGAEEIYLHAQVPVIGFYERMGFCCVGPVFDEAGIPHRRMIFLRKVAAKNVVPHA